MAAAMDNNKAVARQERQRGGHNYQMMMMFKCSGGRGRSTAVMVENGEGGAFHGGSNGRRQGNGATRLGGSNRTRARGGYNVGGQELQRSIGGGTSGWELEANKPNGGRRASDSHSLVFLPIILRRGIQQPARE
jgi:hypothetical protein